MTAIAHGNPSRAPEQRWRRTIDRRGRPTRLTVGRLLRDFGYSGLGPESEQTIESRLAEVGVSIDPPLSGADANTIVTLDTVPSAPAAAVAAQEGALPTPHADPPPGPHRPAQAPGPPTPSRAPGPPAPDPPAKLPVTHSALRAAKGAAERLAELENALYQERAEKEAALRQVEELTAALDRRPAENAANEAGERSPGPAPSAPRPRAIELGRRDDSAGEERQRGRGIGPLRLSRRKESANPGRESANPPRRFRKGRTKQCASCGREAESAAKHELEAGGWIIMGEAALCSSCTADGWRLTPRTRRPYRLTDA